jgi:type III restriction enzyme
VRHHTAVRDPACVTDGRNVIAYFAQTLMKDLRLVIGYDVLYGKVKAFVQDELFEHCVDLVNPTTREV